VVQSLDTTISLARLLILRPGRYTMADQAPGFIIAVVDDDQRFLQSLESLLESAGHTVFLFASAAAFLESERLAEIDCLISDLNMPVMDGLELSRVVQATRPALPIVLISAHPEMLTQLRAANLSHYALFTKPFDAQQLLSALSDLLGVAHLR
jgi:FixJ family two-component response regulator